MTESQQQQPAQTTPPRAEQPATGAGGRHGAPGATGGGEGALSAAGRSQDTPDVFGDGSTREQREAHVQAAEETNKMIKEVGDAERKARQP